MNFMNCRPFPAVLLLATLLMSSACVYRANISQGNIVVEEDLDQVELDMTRNQVRFLLGTPVVEDAFNQDRWDYIYYFKRGRGKRADRRWLILIFEDDQVAEIRRDVIVEPS